MVATVGSLNVNATMQTAAFDKGVEKLQGKLKGLQANFASVGAKMSSIGKGMTIGITAPFAALLSKAIPAAKESREALGQVNAALASMGPVAGRTSEQLQKAAKGLQGLSTFDDDEILRKVTANMLTFGNVAGEQFDRAQLAAVNLATRMGGDLQGATMMIGKALNSPAEGIAKLSRAGIQFTDQQKEQIKAMSAAGNAAGAQAIMLAELERQFGGSAAAMRAADPSAGLKQTWGDFTEQVGELALQVLPPLTNILSKVLDAFNKMSPATQTWAVGGVALVAALGPVMMVLGPMVTGIGALLPLMVKLGPALSIVGKALLFIGANPVILGLAAVIGGIYLAWKNWDAITAIVQRTVQGVKTWIGDKLGQVLAAAEKKVRQFAAPFVWLYNTLVGNSVVPELIDGIAAQMRRLDAVMVQPVKDATSKVAQAFRDLQQDTANLLGRLFPEAQAGNQFSADASTLEAAARAGVISIDQMKAALARLYAGLPAIEETVAVAEEAGEAFEQMAEKSPFQQWAETIPQKAAAIRDAFQGIAMQGLDSLADAITGVVMGTQSLGAAFKSVASQVIADIIRMTARMLIFRAISGLFGGAFGGGAAPGNDIVVTGLPTKLPGFAKGGSFTVGGAGGIDRNLLSLNGSPVARVSRGERINVDTANSGSQELIVHVNASEDFNVRVERLAGGVVAQTAPTIVKAAAMHTARSFSRPRLP